MPIYLYQCDTCGLRFEKLQRMTDDPVTDCPECDGHVHRVIQPVGVIFKGSGFYVTDNRKSSSPTLSKPSTTDKSDGDKPASDAGESKVESAPASTGESSDD